MFPFLFLSLFNFSLPSQNLSTEHARQAFILRDKDQSGTIPATEFVDLMKKIRGFEMSDCVQNHVCQHVSLYTIYMYNYVHVYIYTQVAGSLGRRVRYPYFKAFNEMLGNLDLFRNLVQAVCDREGKATQGMIHKLPYFMYMYNCERHVYHCETRIYYSLHKYVFYMYSICISLLVMHRMGLVISIGHYQS